VINKTISPAQENTNPIILAVETSGRCGSVALVTANKCLAEYSLNTKLTHSRRLLLVIDELLKKAELKLTDLTTLAVSIGPGSFTGLRIGLSTLKGLALATELPMIGIPTLEALAFQLPFADKPICPIIDARKKEVFAAMYQWQDNTILEKLSEDLAILPLDLVDRISGPTIFIGDGIETYGDFLKEKLGEKALFAPSEMCYARAASIGHLALKKCQKADFLHTETSAPVYVRPSEAEINFNKKKK